MADLTEEEFAFFIWKLGWLVFNSVEGASFARHNWPLSTAPDYLDVYPDDERSEALAKKYWKDLCRRQLNTDEMAQKWFDSTPQEMSAEASEMLAELRKGKGKAD